MSPRAARKIRQGLDLAKRVQNWERQSLEVDSDGRWTTANGRAVPWLVGEAYHRSMSAWRRRQPPPRAAGFFRAK